MGRQEPLIYKFLRLVIQKKKKTRNKYCQVLDNQCYCWWETIQVNGDFFEIN